MDDRGSFHDIVPVAMTTGLPPPVSVHVNRKNVELLRSNYSATTTEGLRPNLLKLISSNQDVVDESEKCEFGPFGCRLKHDMFIFRRSRID